jgi:UDP-3-O-[3-hydroxymyristoyl] glucosamine N-acyltransferase
MKKTLAEIAKFVGGEVVGDPRVEIAGVSGIKEAKRGDITFLANRRYMPLLDETQASAVITPLDMDKVSKPTIKARDPSLAFAQVANLFHPVSVRHPKGVHKTAVIAKVVI